MADDEKLAFYLKHRAQIEQWAALQAQAAASLDRAMLAGVQRLTDDPQLPDPEVSTGTPRIVKLRLPDVSAPVWIELHWKAKELFSGRAGDPWPFLIVAVTPKQEHLPLRQEVKGATRVHAQRLGLTQEGGVGSWWAWFGVLQPSTEPIVIDALAEECVDRMRRAWLDMNEPIRAAVRSLRRGAG